MNQEKSVFNTFDFLTTLRIGLQLLEDEIEMLRRAPGKEDR